jgi:hypothetical protein
METPATKLCTRCGKQLPTTLEFFYPARVGKFGLSAWCRPCQRDANKESMQRKRMGEPTIRRQKAITKLPPTPIHPVVDVPATQSGPVPMPLEFPKTIVKVWRSQPDAPFSHQAQLRYYLRVEATKYWVTGYEHEHTPGVYLKDLNLYAVDQDLGSALLKLRKELNAALEDRDTMDAHIGAVRYALTSDKVVDVGKCVKSSNFVDVPDGTYEAMVKGDIGRLTTKAGVAYQFVLPEPVPKANTTVTVQSKQVYVYV